MARKRTLLLFLLPGVLLYGFLFLYPTAAGLFYSFTDWDGLSPSFRFVGLDNYATSLESLVFQKAVFNNVKFMLAVVIAQSALSLGLALLLARNSRSSTALRALYFFPAILSSVSVGLIWSFVYDPGIGMLNASLRAAGLESWTRNWIGSKDIAIYSIAFVQVWAHAGQMMIVFIAGLQSIPAELYESARIEEGTGCRFSAASPGRCWRRRRRSSSPTRRSSRSRRSTSSSS